MGCIYKITNIINGKVYIGQTVRDVDCRWKEHLRHGESPESHEYSYHLYRAMRKYGKENFIINEIENCNIKDLDEREIFWIDFYNSYDENYGYNMTRGGGGARYLEHDEIFSRYDNGESLAEIAEHMHIGRSNLTQILKGYKNYDPSIVWERSKKYSSKKKGTPVKQYDLDGKFIAEYPSSKSAARLVPRTSHANISKSCKFKNCLSGSFQWRYSTDEPPGKYNNRPRSASKMVYQFDTCLNFINSYESLSLAEKETGINRGSISKCCMNDQNYTTAGGFIWSYSKELMEVA